MLKDRLEACLGAGAVYGDVDAGALMVVDSDGGTPDVLIEVEGVACPAISTDGEVIAASGGAGMAVFT